MKSFKPLFFLSLLFISLSSCSSIVADIYNGTSSYLGVGQTAKTGKLSQTINRLDYVPSPSYLDENEMLFELEYSLHSDYDAITALGGIMSYYAIFDNNSNNGGVVLFGTSTTPNSIAPNSDEAVILTLKCFKDWKTAEISYRDNNNNSYSFSIRSSDYPDYANNNYITLKAGESFVEETNKMRIAFQSIRTTTEIPSSDNFDYVDFVVSLKSLVDEDISLPPTIYDYYVKCDAGFSSSNFRITTKVLPSVLPANGSADLYFVISISKGWQKLEFGCSARDTVNYKFMILHADNPY